MCVAFSLRVGMIALGVGVILALDTLGRAEEGEGPAAAVKDAPADEPSAAPLTDAECRAFARKLARAVNAGDTNVFDQLVDYDALCKKATEGVNTTDELKAGFRQGVMSGRKKRGGEEFVLEFRKKPGGSYTLLRIHEKEGRKRALFRLIGPDSGGFNYHDYILSRRSDGSVRAIDFYAASLGGTLSENLPPGSVGGPGPAAPQLAVAPARRRAGPRQEHGQSQADERGRPGRPAP